MTNLMRLIRLPNLIIIALTMCGVRYGLLETLWLNAGNLLLGEGAASIADWRLHMKGFDFFLLLTSVLLIAAGGYIINDYFDLKADRINKPERMVIGSVVGRRKAIVSHLLLSFMGLALGMLVASRAGNIKLASIQLFSIAALWFYSSHLKKQLLSGNLLIALLAAMVPLTTGLFEFASEAMPSLRKLDFLVPGAGSMLLNKAAMLVVSVSLFAFLTNLIREIIKDTEDMQGDAAAGCHTLPILIGESRTKLLLIFLIFFTAGLLGFALEMLWQAEWFLLFWFTLISVLFPMLALAYLVWKAAEKSDYSRASLVCKLIIVSGVLALFIFRYN